MVHFLPGSPHGRIGAWLYAKLFEMGQRMQRTPAAPGPPWNTGETWSLGDSPLVVLTALTQWQPSNYRQRTRFAYERTGDRLHDEIPAPRIGPGGNYIPRADGRTIRAYHSVDNRLMLGDFFAKMRINYPSPS